MNQTDNAGGLDRSGQIAQVADGLYAALGMTGSKVAYDYERHAESGCGITLGIPPGLQQGQAWYARQGFALSGHGPYDSVGLFDDTVRYFDSQGWQTTTYRKSTNLQGLRAVKGDVGVLLNVPVFDLLVTAGPCGDLLTRFDDTWTAEPG